MPDRLEKAGAKSAGRRTGSAVTVIPQFLKGSDTNPDEDESLEVLVNVSAAIGSESAAQTYGVTIEQDDNPVQYAQLTDGAPAKANPQQKAVVKQGEPAKCVELQNGIFNAKVGGVPYIGGWAIMQVLDVNNKPTGAGGKPEETVFALTIHKEVFAKLAGDPVAKWYSMGDSFDVPSGWTNVTDKPVDAKSKFRDEPMGPAKADMKLLLAGTLIVARNDPRYGALAQKVRIRHEFTHEYRIQWQGAIYPNNGNALIGKWNRIGTYELNANGDAACTSFTSTPK